MLRWKRPIAAAVLLLFLIVPLLSADGTIALDLRLARLDGPVAPETINGDVLFTYSSERRVRHVGIAFGHENFSTVHTFYRWRPFGNGAAPAPGDLFFLAYPAPHDATRLEYRLIVDGVWMADPINPLSRRDREGTSISIFDLPERARPRPATPIPVADRRNVVRFVFEPAEPGLGGLRSIYGRELFLPGDRGLDVRVAGTFNRWDPFMHPLREDPLYPGRYVAEITLPRGRHNYYFVVDGRRLLDPRNPDRRYHRDGYSVSTFSVP